MARKRRSVSFPIVLGALTVGLSIALLVGWTLVIVQNLNLTDQVAQNVWLLTLGSVSFVVIITVLVLLSVFLTREIRMVNRQTRFIDSVTHELKSPLASLKLCLETMRRADVVESQRENLREMMMDDVERLTIFIDDILEASRVTGGSRGHAVDSIFLRELIDHCADRIVRQYKHPDSIISVKVPPSLVIVSDRTALETVLTNLLDNAVKYSLNLPGRPIEVTVEAHATSRHVHIVVRDRGVGIPKKHLKSIFERFYRVPNKDVRGRRGTGLGLYVVSGLVRILGGKLSAHSGGEGLGTEMRIRLPSRAPAKRELART
ncbi:MAG: HAMP domain-containing sensor histidine kinase [Planctomycetota bacterium]